MKPIRHLLATLRSAPAGMPTPPSTSPRQHPPAVAVAPSWSASTIAFAAVGVLAAWTGPSSAQPGATPLMEVPALLAQAARLSLEQAAQRVQQSTGGRVLDARDAGSVYRIKVLTPGGEVRIVLVDPRSGAMR
jgi:hypothetical protein